MQTYKRIITSVLLISVIACYCTSFVYGEERVFNNIYDYYESFYFDFDPDDEYVLLDSGTSDGEYDMSTYAVSGGTKNNENFNQDVLNMIDLNTIPQEVYDIIHSDNRYIILQVWNTSYRIFVLRNGYVYRTYKVTGTDENQTLVDYHTNFFGIGTYVSDNPDEYITNSCLWEAVYDFNGSLISSWKSDSYVSLSSKFGCWENFKAYRYEIAGDESDFYTIGSNTNFRKTSDTALISWLGAGGVVGSTTYSLQCRCKLSSIFCCGRYLSEGELSFPSFESQTNDTQKGILGKLGELLTKIKSLPGEISAMFTTLKDNISSMLNTLRNYILYFSSETKSRPKSLFDDVIADVKEFTDRYTETLLSFGETAAEAVENVKEYLLTGTHILNRFFDGVPIFNYILSFVLVVIIIRKAVGR